ncbi:LxmA leader domain family RiPP [Nocardioides zeae]|uniref:LxmA leader domain family RiPP n=1 Tax=Nocardioides imazamoxiresistens TaxID=3231893 RepID=A0ABU3PV46_9ACTN|nr:LxmA leader domain family RiPP [Nocardioides zeae]MDT9593107.1 LxmA leader domain family RiPP [Nocardioides zeae]
MSTQQLIAGYAAYADPGAISAEASGPGRITPTTVPVPTPTMPSTSWISPLTPGQP